jgi:hypothetical protein
LTAAAVRERAHEMLAAGVADELPHFRIDLTRLAPTAGFVANVIRENYPDLKVPLHARWRHFVFGGRDLWAETARKVRWSDTKARARAEFDLAIVSVLLDAGAGADWRFHDRATGLRIGRSEGLALASLRMFEAGLFSSNRSNPLRVDAERLAALTGKELEVGLQAGESNALAGLAGRAALLSRLGQHMLDQPKIFAEFDCARAGGLFDHFTNIADNESLPAPAILHALLMNLGPIWSGRTTLGGISLGDTWRHHVIRRADATDGFIPLHKLSQWLAYSLIEPLQAAGMTVTGIDGLTGLAEYRNGGLFVDSDVIVLRDRAQADQSHQVDSELIVEWRALTVALLDRLAPLVREELGLPAQQFSLGQMLEGGSWAAGRKLAALKRRDSGPPFRVISDGTVF